MDNKDVLVSGTKWTTISTLAISIVQVLRLSILARFLDKADFGIVAIITFILGLTQTFSDLGIASTIIHKKDLSREEFSSLYWIQFLFFALAYIIVIACTPLIASFYNEAILMTLLPISMLDMLFWGIGRLYDVTLQKQFQFRTIAIRNIVSVLISLLIAVVLAIFGAGVYSLIISTLSQSLILNIWNLISGQKVIKVKFFCSFKQVLPLLRIGLYQMGTQLLDYVSSRFDILIIGKFLGKEYLGIYNLAKELVLKIIVIVNTIANKVSLPYFARIQDDVDTLRNNYLKMVKLLSAINIPTCFLCAIFGPLIVFVLYGESYMEVANVLPILCIWGCFVSVMNPTANIVIAKGRTDLSLYYTMIRVCYALPIVYVFSKYGLYAVAFAQIFIAVIDLLLSWKIQLNKVIGLSIVDYFNVFALFVFLSIVIGGLWQVCYSLNVFCLPSTLKMIIYSVLASLVLLVCWVHIYSDEKKMLLNVIIKK